MNAPAHFPPHLALAITGPQLSLVSPAYREDENIEPLYQRLCAVLDPLGIEWEWIVVDDHSPDRSFERLQSLAARDRRVHGLRLSRNGGSHAAIAVGLAHARGAAVAVLAADLQDPPEIIPALLAAWRDGAQVVWAARRTAPPGPLLDRLGSRLFHGLLRRAADFEGVPPFGADFFLLDRVAVDALAQFDERRANLIALLHWMGFRQASVDYDKAARASGRSGWSLGQKIELVIDSVTAFSIRPIRWMSFTGAVTALAGFAGAGWVIVNALIGSPPSGWSSLMVAVLGLGGLQMLMMGVLGEYLWRTLEESRRRPRALIEAVTTPLLPK